MVILVIFMVISVNRRLFRYFGSYSGISVIPVILVNRRTAILGPANFEFSLVLASSRKNCKVSTSESAFLGFVM